MLSPRLTTYPDCASVSVLLQDIECKIFEIAKNMYNNIIFALNKPLDPNTMIDLLNYRRILIYKACNSEYAGCYTIDMIASKVKILKYK